jgi:hypothetical protein
VIASSTWSGACSTPAWTGRVSSGSTVTISSRPSIARTPDAHMRFHYAAKTRHSLVRMRGAGIDCAKTQLLFENECAQRNF